MLNPGFASLSVLIIDDIANTRQVLRAVLRAIGINHVVEASGAVEGFQIAKTEAPDIIFTDWDMPGATGLDLVRLIRSRPDSPDPMMPVILLTAHGNREYVTLARDCGATDFLIKPFSPQRIGARILDVVGRQRPFVLAPDYKGPDRRRAKRSVAVDRRSPQSPVPGVVLIAPDDLLAAKVSGDLASFESAQRCRAEALRALHNANNPDTREQAGVSGTLYTLAGRALEAMDVVAEMLAGMADPLTIFRRSGVEHLPPWAIRITASLQRLMSERSLEKTDPVVLRLHLLALRAMLRASHDAAAARTAEELATQIEMLENDRRN
ncbi:MAG: response regulator [Rhodospirillaceae bacterium]